jgi:hypothetical protein
MQPGESWVVLESCLPVINDSWFYALQCGDLDGVWTSDYLKDEVLTFVMSPEVLSEFVERIGVVRANEDAGEWPEFAGTQLGYVLAEVDALFAVASRAQRLGRSLAYSVLL